MAKINKVIFLLLIFFTLNTYADDNPDSNSVLEKKYLYKQNIYNNPLSIILYKPTYLLPYYYTASPDEAVYNNNTPDNQKVMNAELKGQLSLMVPIVPKLFNSDTTSLNIAYTQLSYWQVYADSQYFRETDYEPELFIEKHLYDNWLLRGGLDHQSNGRGGSLERSWNRAYGTVQTSGSNWLIGLTVWTLVSPGDSSDVHNPDIAHYLGYENILFAHKIYSSTVSLELQNLESGLSRGFIQATYSYPFSKHISGYIQYFNGYGQSLIEYNHRTQGVGVGISFNNWI